MWTSLEQVEDRVEKLVRLHCQHAPAVSEHPEAAWLYGKVSALNWFISPLFFGVEYAAFKL